MLMRLLLRSLALALKFALAIIVARTLGFDAVAAYGLAVAAAVITSKLLGLGFSPELNRRLSEPDPLPAFGAMRTLCIAYGGIYLLLVATLAIATANGDAALLARVGLPTRLAWCVLLVALSEHAAFEANGWLFSLHRPRAGSLLLFVRTGAWAGVAGAGLLVGALHSIEAVFALWFTANACVVALSRWRIGAVARQVRGRPQAARTLAVRERGVLSVWRHGLPFYVAGVVLASLQYAERFIGGGHLSADALGRYVFAWSIANAIQALAFSTVVVTAGPRLVRVLSDAPHTFSRLAVRATVASVIVTSIAAAAVLALHRDLFALAHEPANAGQFALLAILLVSFVLRGAADVLWTAAIALRAGRAVMVSTIALALSYLPLAWSLIVHAGAMGAAIAHLTASAGIVAALALIVARAGRSRATFSTEVAHHAA
ncbi:putative polysaccharide biosynthesis transporter protein [Burkholderia aenigmatica]|uniref:Polysaccharide biosynthesis transporter protein n=2 Tax=Burkholderia TaxID=32008 RepID=A0ABY6XN13_9BURK|nr:polysaccharide biosynthesis protein [Burkholderia aenigmatica]VWC58262.1 putative polysaccharide biosynthesis transporter protein [Burkholderia aenigmatica]VWC83883.1 putative polysaccharide biosynthesis transporter protein [Burkholderia aenigmatica]